MQPEAIYTFDVSKIRRMLANCDQSGRAHMLHHCNQPATTTEGVKLCVGYLFLPHYAFTQTR